MLVAILIGIGLLGVALFLYAKFAPSKTAAQSLNSKIEPAQVAEPVESPWTNEAGAEFAGLSESARCDLIFAVAALDDEASARLLVHALDDPSPTVALAAAHALARGGRIDEVSEYARTHDGARSEELLQLLSLLA